MLGIGGASSSRCSAGAAAWPLAARAQQPARAGDRLSQRATRPSADGSAVFKQTLAEAATSRGEQSGNRDPWADGTLRAPAGAGGGPGAKPSGRDHRRHRRSGLDAKEATATMPIVFDNVDDPVELGLVAKPIETRRQCDRLQLSVQPN